MVVGFVIAAYSIVANDAIQTLGTFLASNGRRPWWQLWIFGGAILTFVLVYGWMTTDVAYGKLEKYPLPQPFSWIYVVPPIVLLLITRLGIPVSTTFLVLTVFAPKNLEMMVLKSGLGYLVAFASAILIYLLTARVVERRFMDTATEDPPSHWLALQWASTAWLWGNWLIQDLANIFVFLPRDLDAAWLAFALVVMLGLLAFTFATSGGAIQRIVTSKTNTDDIRSATLINFLYGCVLFLFKDGYVMWFVTGTVERLPMSTTWVFLGLLAGREIGMTIRLSQREMGQTLQIVGADAAKAFVGLAVSVVVALGLPIVAGTIVEDAPHDEAPADPTPADDAAAVLPD